MLSDEALARIADSHQHVTSNGIVEPGTGFLAGDHCFAGALPSAPAEAESSEFDIAGLAGVRRRVEVIGRRGGLASLHTSDLAVAANELATNSVAHGGGHGTLRTWLEPDRVVVEVEDRGRILDPLVGRIRPLVNQEGGRGLWLANQLCDLVQIRSGDAGTTVRLHIGDGVGAVAREGRVHLPSEAVAQLVVSPGLQRGSVSFCERCTRPSPTNVGSTGCLLSTTGRQKSTGSSWELARVLSLQLVRDVTWGWVRLRSGRMWPKARYAICLLPAIGGLHLGELPPKGARQIRPECNRTHPRATPSLVRAVLDEVARRSRRPR